MTKPCYPLRRKLNYDLKYIAVIAIFVCTGTFATEKPDAGIKIADDGSILLNNENLVIFRQSDGSKSVLRSSGKLTPKDPRKILSIYWDAAPLSSILTRHIIIVDATDSGAKVSNPVNTGLDFEWSDNNFSRILADKIYFGIYSPKRMQFMYQNGKLVIDHGPWMGPLAPKIYTEPDKSLPCANVADVPACLAEIEENRGSRGTRRTGKRAAAASTALHR